MLTSLIIKSLSESDFHHPSFGNTFPKWHLLSNWTHHSLEGGNLTCPHLLRFWTKNEESFWKKWVPANKLKSHTRKQKERQNKIIMNVASAMAKQASSLLMATLHKSEWIFMQINVQNIIFFLIDAMDFEEHCIIYFLIVFDLISV